MIAQAVSLILIVSIVVSSGSAISSEKKPEMDKTLEVIFNFNSESKFSSNGAKRWYEIDNIEMFTTN